MNKTTSIPGYAYGQAGLMRSPVSLSDFNLLKKTTLFGDDDVKYLRHIAKPKSVFIALARSMVAF